jgi:L-threonylcarbamoyladenylate synthase
MDTIKLHPGKYTSTIDRALKVLRTGGLVILPTETCYIPGVDATNPNAANKLLQFKTRREGKAFSVAVSDQQMAEQYVTLNQSAKHLYQAFLPGPMTVISKLKSKSRIAPGVASEAGTLGIRIPDYPFVLNLITRFGRPITATSANVSYKPTPYSLSQWQKDTPKKSRDLVDLWIDAGPLPRRPTSTVIDTTTDELTIVRQGSIKISQPSESVTTHSETETRSLAAKVVERYRDTIHKRGLAIALQGELGAGKTIFTQGAAQALGIKQRIKSPTFTLVHEYPIISLESQKSNARPERSRRIKGRKPPSGTFYHLDAWRLEKSQELLDLDFKDMLKPGNVIAIEWAEKVFPVVKKLCRQNNVVLITTTIDVLAPITRRWRFST